MQYIALISSISAIRAMFALLLIEETKYEPGTRDCPTGMMRRKMTLLARNTAMNGLVIAELAHSSPSAPRHSDDRQ